jgi:hypothetical protein
MSISSKFDQFTSPITKKLKNYPEELIPLNLYNFKRKRQIEKRNRELCSGYWTNTKQSKNALFISYENTLTHGRNN